VLDKLRIAIGLAAGFKTLLGGGGVAAVVTYVAWAIGVFAGASWTQIILTLGGILFISVLPVFVLLIAIEMYAGRPVKKLLFAYGDDLAEDTPKGRRFSLTVTNTSRFPLKQVRVQIMQTRADPSSDFERNRQVSYVKHCYLTVARGEPETGAEDAEGTFLLTAHGGEQKIQVANIYRNCKEIYVLITDGMENRFGKFKRKDAKLPSGMYVVKLRAEGDERFYGEAIVRFGVVSGAENFNPIFRIIDVFGS
jgi:hypothetical protein